MRKSLCVGILREPREEERRAPLAPHDVRWLVNRGIGVEVETSCSRIFKNIEYRKSGARIVDRFRKASFLIGIKAPKIEDIYNDKIYMTFSHTVKGQSQNISLLKAFLEKGITLIDYEKIADLYGKRIVYFGRFAGICGAVDSLYYFGKKLEWQGMKNPFSSLKPAYEYDSLSAVTQAITELYTRIQKRGFEKALCPFIIGISGHGNVSKGVQEVLNLLNPIEVHPRDMLRFVRHQRGMRNRIYKIVFFREEKFRSKNGKGFYFEKYLKCPDKFESNMDTYLQYLNMLIHTSYWEKAYPRTVTKEMIHKLTTKKPFRLGFIGDIACDINGSIELTYKTTTSKNPVFTYNPKNRTFADGYKKQGISVLAIDNLPSELPKDSSVEFSSLIHDYVYQIAAHGVKDITRHAALPVEIRKAVVTEEGKLTKRFDYLKKILARQTAINKKRCADALLLNR